MGIAIPRPTPCNHGGLYWYSDRGATNEEGWRCVDCDVRPGEPPGYSPAHDVSHLRVKILCILHDLHDAGIIYISSSDMGEGLADGISRVVEESGNRDQYSIVRAILDALTPHHAAFWRERSDKIRAGNDDRERCGCGQLACCFSSNGNGKSTATCGRSACSYDRESRKW